VVNIQQNVSLKDYSTMKLGGPAKYLVIISDRNELVEAYKWAKENKLSVRMIGIGSNIIWRDEGYPGLVMVNKIKRYESYNEDAENLYVTAGAGEVWDEIVEKTVNLGYSGIEQLSLIPGTVGATPVQNVGAYGREIADVIVAVEAYDSQADKFINLSPVDCGFTYRSSKFKTTDKDRYFISAITIHLARVAPEPPFYPALQHYFEDNQISRITVKTVRDAVIAIRQSKLPDPKTIANVGSYFKNPIISAFELTDLSFNNPGIVYWPLDDDKEKIKLSAAWLIQQVVKDGVHDPATGMALWPKHSLVFINEAAKSTGDLLKFRDKVISAVEKRFHVKLEQEPELLP
jgi:UDP-N-acetylmuramate dehydrogenase